MSLYNMINGVTQATFFILPMLGKHPDEYPRFRDCFLKDEEHPEYDRYIQVYTRVGGGNRESYQNEIDELRKQDEYVTDFDDNFDSTFATFVFKVPERFKEDFDKCLSGNILETSDEYKDILKKVYPKLKDKFEEMFKKEGDVQNDDDSQKES